MRFNIVMGKLEAETFSGLWNLLERADILMIKIAHICLLHFCIKFILFY